MKPARQVISMSCLCRRLTSAFNAFSPSPYTLAASHNCGAVRSRPGMAVAGFICRFFGAGVVGGEFHVCRLGEGRDQAPAANGQLAAVIGVINGAAHEGAG